LTFNALEPERGQVDGTIARAVERLILISAEKAGYEWLYARPAKVLALLRVRGAKPAPRQLNRPGFCPSYIFMDD
jgi:hypothetical protein